MINKWTFYTILTSIIAFISYSFKPLETLSNDWFLTSKKDEIFYSFPSQKQDNFTDLPVPFTGKFFIGYKESIAQKESQGQYKKINSLGYLGKYQFGESTLKTIGIYNRTHFLNNKVLQEKAFVTLLSKNKSLLKEIIKEHDGKIFAGIYVTESGILAAAHLGGVGSVKRFFKHEGRRSFKDVYGTSISSYMKEFSGYETSSIVANSDAKVKL